MILKYVEITNVNLYYCGDEYIIRQLDVTIFFRGNYNIIWLLPKAVLPFIDVMADSFIPVFACT